MPLLLVVSQTGLLTLFNIINLNKQAAQVCTPPQQLTLPAAAMTRDIPDDVPQPVAQIAPVVSKVSLCLYTMIPTNPHWARVMVMVRSPYV
jgi:hypothetical protein